eukprot:g11506.t1
MQALVQEGKGEGKEGQPSLLDDVSPALNLFRSNVVGNDDSSVLATWTLPQQPVQKTHHKRKSAGPSPPPRPANLRDRPLLWRPTRFAPAGEDSDSSGSSGGGGGAGGGGTGSCELRATKPSNGTIRRGLGSSSSSSSNSNSSSSGNGGVGKASTRQCVDSRSAAVPKDGRGSAPTLVRQARVEAGKDVRPPNIPPSELLHNAFSNMMGLDEPLPSKEQRGQADGPSAAATATLEHPGGYKHCFQHGTAGAGRKPHPGFTTIHTQNGLDQFTAKWEEGRLRGKKMLLDTQHIH